MIAPERTAGKPFLRGKYAAKTGKQRQPLWRSAAHGCGIFDAAESRIR